MFILKGVNFSFKKMYGSKSGCTRDTAQLSGPTNYIQPRLCPASLLMLPVIGLGWSMGQGSLVFPMPMEPVEKHCIFSCFLASLEVCRLVAVTHFPLIIIFVLQELHRECSARSSRETEQNQDNVDAEFFLCSS